MKTHPMTAPKHTPGKWSASRMILGSSKDRRTGFVVNGPDAGPLPVRICDLRCSPESPFAMTEANAQLIAAAPELLEALKLAHAALGESRGYHQSTTAGVIRAAIAKAEAGA